MHCPPLHCNLVFHKANLNGSICFSDSESFDNGFKVIKYDVAYIGNKNDLNMFFSIALY